MHGESGGSEDGCGDREGPEDLRNGRPGSRHKDNGVGRGR